MPPTASQPSSSGSTSVDRGVISFEASALSNDLVDDIGTMFPTVQYSPSSIQHGAMIGSPTTPSSELVIMLDSFEIDTHLDATMGYYDLRIKWTDSSGQTSDWLTSEEAFYSAELPSRVLGNGDMTYAGRPHCKGCRPLRWVISSRTRFGCRDSVVQFRNL